MYKGTQDYACSCRTKINVSDAFFLRLFVKLLESDKPRCVEANRQHHVIIGTDACYERESRELVCGLGGVSFDPAFSY